MTILNSLLTIFLTTITILATGQSNIDFGQLTNSWTQGRIDADGKVIKAEVNRGGWYHLNINTDTTVVFSDPFTCGFGHKREGKWTMSKSDTTVIFYFDKRVGYMNSPGTADIKETEIYKIEKLTVDELILKKMGQEKTGDATTLPFLRTDRTKD